MVKKVIFGIRPEHLNISSEETGLKCAVEAVEHLGNECIVYGKLKSDVGEFSLKDDGNSVIVKVIEGTKVEVGDVISLVVNEDKVHFFDGETEVTIMKKIPDSISTKAKIINGKIEIFGEKAEANGVFKNSISENTEFSVEISPSSIIEGNTFSLPVLKVEKVDDKNLAHLKCGDSCIFALVDDDVKEGNEYKFDLLYDKLKISINGETVLSPINNSVEFVGKFSKKEIRELVGKKKKEYIISITISEIIKLKHQLKMDLRSILSIRMHVTRKIIDI